MRNVPEPPPRRQGAPALGALLKTARRMRDAQKAFHEAQGGDRRSLVIRAKQLEKQFDALLDAFPDPDKPVDMFAPDPTREEGVTP